MVSFRAIAGALLGLATIARGAVNVTVEYSDRRISYANGDWERGEECGFLTWTRSASATFKFNGTAIYVVGSRSSVGGVINFSLDGTDSVVDRTSDVPEVTCGQVLFGRYGLRDAEHTLVVTLTGASSPGANAPAYLELERIIFTVDDLAHVPPIPTVASLQSSSTGIPRSYTTVTVEAATASAEPAPISRSVSPAIVGVIVGGIIFGLAIGFIIFVLIMRRRRAARPKTNANGLPIVMPRRPSAASSIAAADKEGRRTLTEIDIDSLRRQAQQMRRKDEELPALY